METTEKINIRGAIRSLAFVNDKVTFPRSGDYMPSTIRNTASSVKGDTGRQFRVEVENTDKMTH